MKNQHSTALLFLTLVHGAALTFAQIPQAAREAFDYAIGQGKISTTDQSSGEGKALLEILAGNNDVEVSNFGWGSFKLQNTGSKRIAAVFIDVTDSIFSDVVFDDDGSGGDSVAKDLNYDQGQNAVQPVDIDEYQWLWLDARRSDFNPGADFDPNDLGNENNLFVDDVTDSGAKAAGGYRGELLLFTDFTAGESVSFSGDMDPNSIAGFDKGTVDSGASWDVGGVSGAEMVNGVVSVLFGDGSTISGTIASDGSQSGGVAVISSDLASAPGLTVNGLRGGESGTYSTSPKVVVTSRPGDTVRVSKVKAFDPTANTENLGGITVAALVEARLQVQYPEFPVNNAKEWQHIEVQIPRSGSGSFDVTDLFEYDEDLAIAFDAVIVNGDGSPLSRTTEPIRLLFSDGPATTNAPVPSPTDAPVVAPTDAPVPSPTDAPVVAPTDAPVVAPTEAPVPSPTDAPVVAPTDAPVVAPTDAPVVAPTDAPVVAPTDAPAVAPTDAPVVSPTDAPVPAPTGAPVIAPTDAPVVAPTDAPVVAPTDAPVVATTDAPVVATTDSPVAAPTDSPVVAPTDAPVVALTDAPVVAPTEAPVVAPSDAPVVAPTDAPVVSPTDEPVPAPTDAPVASPTDAPVVEPTDTPVVAPTDAPVVAPTDAPVVAPTDAPVVSPTDAPVPAPTDTPVASPTDAPVVAATGAPVASPTDAPVPDPTDAPISSSPTRAPIASSVPAPTGSPTVSPTKAPWAPIFVSTPVFAPVSTPVTPPSSPTPSEGVTGFNLIHAPTGAVMMSLFDGAVVDAKKLGVTAKFNVQAVTAGTTVKSVTFLENKRTENVVPFAFCGDVHGNYYSCDEFAPGRTVTVTAMPYGGPHRSGTVFPVASVTFTISNGNIGTPPSDGPCGVSDHQNECSNTRQCRGMYARADDCWNGGGGVCLCGGDICGCL